mgnify:CR=1 FL=1
MFTITTSAASGTPATLAKAMAKQVTPQRLLTAMMDTTSMWASLTLPEGVTDARPVVCVTRAKLQDFFAFGSFYGHLAAFAFGVYTGHFGGSHDLHA